MAPLLFRGPPLYFPGGKLHLKVKLIPRGKEGETHGKLCQTEGER